MNPSDPDRSELDAVDDAALNEYLRRDSAVSQRYRELGADDVPAALDQAVLAQAKAAVANKKPSRWRNVARWGAPLALAASVVLVVSIVLQPSMQTELSRITVPAAAPLPQAMEERSVSQPVEAKKQEAARADVAAESANAPVMLTPSNQSSAQSLPEFAPASEVAAAAPAPAPAEKAKEADPSSRIVNMRQQVRSTTASAPPPPPPRQEVEVTARRVEPKQAESAAPVAIDVNAAADAKRRERERSDDTGIEEAIVTGALRQQPAAGAGPRGTVQPSRSMANEAGHQFDKNDPASWLDYIRSLRAEGESSRADGEWRRFRRQYPDFTVDASDKARPRRR